MSFIDLILPFLPPPGKRDDDIPETRHLSRKVRGLIHNEAQKRLVRQPHAWLWLVVFVGINVVGVLYLFDSCFGEVLVFALVVSVSYLLLIPALRQATRSYLSEHAENGKMKECLECGYDLRGTPGDTCSECGSWIRVDRIMIDSLRRIRR